MTATFPAQLQIMLTERCNLRCVHCAVPEEDSPASHELSTEDWFAFLDRAAIHGVPSVVLSGGEALLRRDCVQLMVHAQERGICNTTIVTNLAVMSPRILDELVHAQQQYPGFGLQVSIDGASDATHDWMRGAGQFRALLNNAARLRAAGGRIGGVNTVFHRGNHHEVDAIASLTCDLGGTNWRLFPVAAIGRGRGIQPEQLSQHAWNDLLARLPELRRRYGLDVVSMGPVLESPHGDEPSPNPSSVDTNRIIVGPDGELFPCPPLRLKRLGNVTEIVDDRSWGQACDRTRSVLSTHCANCRYLLMCVGVDADAPFRTAPGHVFDEPGVSPGAAS